MSQALDDCGFINKVFAFELEMGQGRGRAGQGRAGQESPLETAEAVGGKGRGVTKFSNYKQAHFLHLIGAT